MNIIKFALIIALFTAFTINAEAGNADQMNRCSDLVRQRSAALTVRDWNNLERLAKKYIVDCKTVVGDESLSYAYLDIATSLFERSRYKEAIEAADAGINLKYDDPGNHLIKARAYMMLKDNQNAIENLNKTEKIAQLALNNCQEELKYADSNNMKMINSHMNYLKSMLEIIVALREKLQVP